MQGLDDGQQLLWQLVGMLKNAPERVTMRRIQASCFLQDRLWTSLVAQSGSLDLGAGGRDSQASALRF